ncbi:hypothetical protein F4808DRAFT_108083 [Astrocystis sublimbata]|nr:hypothetical protein F4808DRAFT_108083 [Astrocystis sublimbata]
MLRKRSESAINVLHGIRRDRRRMRLYQRDHGMGELHDHHLLSQKSLVAVRDDSQITDGHCYSMISQSECWAREGYHRIRVMSKFTYLYARLAYYPACVMQTQARNGPFFFFFFFLLLFFKELVLLANLLQLKAYSKCRNIGL